MPRLYTFIYHHLCTDGFAAAWLFKKFLDWGAYLYKDNSPNVKFVPRGYDIKSIEDSLIEGREVYIVDFSFPREELIRINSKAEKLIVLEYISDGLGYDADMKIPKLAEEALYAYLSHAILATRINQPEYVIQRLRREKSAKLRNAKIRLSNIKLNEFVQIARGKSK